MTDPQRPDSANSLQAARLWLALLLALLVVALPGPQVATAPFGQVQYLHTPGDALTAIHGRDFIARKDMAQVRPLAAVAIPPPVPSFLPPRDPVPVRYGRQVRRDTGTRPLTPCARDPPVLPMTA